MFKPANISLKLNSESISQWEETISLHQLSPGGHLGAAVCIFVLKQPIRFVASAELIESQKVNLMMSERQPAGSVVTLIRHDY